jgi:hypothetical protein
MLRRVLRCADPSFSQSSSLAVASMSQLPRTDSSLFGIANLLIYLNPNMVVQPLPAGGFAKTDV